MPNLFATGALAKRIEAAEASLVADVGTSVGRRRGESSVYIQAIGGGMAVLSGPDSPVNKVAGLGFEPLDDAILAEVEEAFAARKTPVRVEVSTLADPAVGVLLTGRGYELRGFENVLALALDPTTVPGSIGEIAITDAALGTSQWVDVVVTGFTYPDEFDGPPPTESFGAESLTEIMNDMSEIPGFHRYLGWRNGVVAGGGGLRIFDRVAQLSGASTLPDHRRHGVQTALLQHRLGQAAAAGCDIAVVTTEPGSKSQQNVQRQGFSLLYARAVLVKG